MDTLVGVHVDAWDYLTFAAMFIIVAAGLTLVVLILGLPDGSRLRASIPRQRRSI